jgi:DNA-directed RNA polymerase specialized sigma24 family protein
LKRAGERVTLVDRHTLVTNRTLDILALDEALDRLAQRSERQVLVAELRVFGGLTVAETAEALQVSERTVKYDWRFARAWLARHLGSEPT